MTAAPRTPTPARPAPHPWWRPWRAVLAGLAIAFGLGMVAAEVTRSFTNWNHGYQWEVDLMLRVHHPLPMWLDFLVFVTPWLGTNFTLIPIVAVIAWWLWRRCARPDLAAQLAAVQLGSYFLNPSLKALYERERPSLFERRGWYSLSSYPSGHAIASVAVLLAIAIVVHRARGWRWPFAIVIPIMIASIYSRVYLGVHWPTDVFAGAAVGAVWLCIAMYAFRDRRAASAQETGEAGLVDVPTADDGGDPGTLPERD